MQGRYGVSALHLSRSPGWWGEGAGGQPGGDAGEQPALDLQGSAGPFDGLSRQSGELVVAAPLCVACEDVLLNEPGPEQQGVVRPEGHPGGGVDQGAQRYVLRGVVDPQPDVGRRADLQGDAALDDLLEHVAILDRPDPVPDPVGAEVLETCTHARGTEQLTTVRDGCEAGVPGDPERPGKVL